MRSSVRSAFIPFTSRLEGVVPWMYLDVKGLVTVAIGNLIDPSGYALSLPFVRSDGSAATQREIAAEWLLIKTTTRLAEQGHLAAKSLARLRLTPAGVERVVLDKLASVEGQLVKRFPAFAEWPADAQLATFSMAWACGAGFRFPKMAAALQAQDFVGAARECHMNETGNPGLKPRNLANKAMYLNASKAACPETLYYPGSPTVAA